MANFARDAILTSSAVVFVRYWLVFMNQVRNFPLCFYGSVARFARDEILNLKRGGSREVLVGIF